MSKDLPQCQDPNYHFTDEVQQDHNGNEMIQIKIEPRAADGSERIKNMAQEFHNTNVTEIEVFENKKECMEPVFTPQYVQQLLDKLGLQLKKVHGGYMILEDFSTPLKPGWVETQKCTYHKEIDPSRLRLLVKDAPPAIAYKIGNKWIVHKELFPVYIRSCYKYG